MKYIRNSKCLWSKIGDEVVVLEPHRGLYIGLNSAASTVWEAISEPADIDELVRAVVDCYEVSSDIATNDITHVLTDMLSNRIISLV